MSDIATPPTRRQEDWRYADLAALEKLWPLPVAEAIHVGAGEAYTRAIVQTGGGVTQLALSLAACASASLHVLNGASGVGGGAYARVEITVDLAEGDELLWTHAVNLLLHHALAGARLGLGTNGGKVDLPSCAFAFRAVITLDATLATATCACFGLVAHFTTFPL